MKRFAILLATALAFATPAFADEATTCADGQTSVTEALDNAKANGIETFDYKGDDFTNYVNAVRTLYSIDQFGADADELIEAKIDDDDIFVGLAKDGCIFAFGMVSAAGRNEVLKQAGFPTN